MFSSVCETIVPSTIGRCSRGRPVRRETISAREGSPRRAGSVALISTPMKVPCIASRSRTRPRGIAAFRIACQATARTTIEAHITPRPASTQAGLESSSATAISCTPMRRNASTVPASASAANASIATRRASTSAGLRAPAGGGGSRLGRRCGRTRGCRSAGLAPIRTAARCHDALRRRRRDRVLVRVHHLARDVRPGEALRALGGGAPHCGAPLGLVPQLVQRLGERGRVAARDEQPVDAVAHDVAVAGDVRGDDRRAGREALRQHHPEALAAERRRAQHVGRLRARAASRRRRRAPARSRRDRRAAAARPRRGWRRRPSAPRARRDRAAPRTRAAAPAAPCARRPGRRTRAAAARSRPPHAAPPPRRRPAGGRRWG